MLSRAFIVFAFGLCGCAAAPQATPTTASNEGYTPASRDVGYHEPSVKQQSEAALSKTRCDHALRCDRVGANHLYTSRDQCAADLDSVGYAELETPQCRSIDQNALSVCLASIDVEQCGTDVAESVDRVPECQPSVLCAK